MMALDGKFRGALLLMDRAYSGEETRAFAAESGYTAIVPPTKSHKTPWEYDRAEYKGRNTVERLFRRLKAFRRVCTRYDKTDVMFMAFIQLAFVFIWLK